MKILDIDFVQDDLGEISIEELEKQVISTGFVIHQLKSGKPLLIQKAGEFLSRDEIAKYQKRGIKSFKFLQIANEDFASELSTLFSKLRHTKKEKDKYNVRTEVLKSVSLAFWEGESERSFLDFVIPCYKHFLKLDEKLIKQIQETSLIVYFRSQKVGALAVLMALALGYTDYKFLKDLYQVSFLLDIGLIHKNYTFKIAQACEEERKKAREGVQYLAKVFASDSEYDLYFDHPNIGYAYANENLKDQFHYPEMLQIILRHHEYASKDGFPVGLGEEEVSEWEAIVILADHLIPYLDSTYSKKEGGQYLKEMFNDSSIETSFVPAARILRRFMLEMGKVIEEKKSA